MEENKLFMILLGCRPKGRYTEQHDIFFGIGKSLESLLPDIFEFWPEAKNKIHIDAWRAVTQVSGYKIDVVPADVAVENPVNLFFINLGGYKPGLFDEPHYKMLLATPDKASAIKQAKETAFYQHMGFKGATSHIDDKYGVDVDDLFEIEDILSDRFKAAYKLKISSNENLAEDEFHLGYLPVKNITTAAI